VLKQAELGTPVEGSAGRWASAVQGSTNVLTQEEVRGIGVFRIETRDGCGGWKRRTAS